jgi:hypothetical protein
MSDNDEQWAEHDAALNQLKEKLADRVGNDLNASGDTTLHASTVFHYTDVRSALAIAQSGHFWFTERAHLNDTLELQYGLRIAHEMFSLMIREAGPTVPPDAPAHLMGEFNFGLGQYGYWVASFSFVDDDLSQWRSYADEGRGVCLGFFIQDLDMPQFVSEIPFPYEFLRFRVGYNEDTLRDRLRPYIEPAVDLLKQVNLPGMKSYWQRYGRALLYERDVIQAMMSGVYLHSMMQKHHAYAHECEYRLLISGYRDKFAASDAHKVRERNGEIIGYLDLPIPNWKSSPILRQIKIGPAAPDKLGEQLVTALRSLHLPLPKITRSILPFRTTR